MAVFSVDSDAVLGATAPIRATADRIQSEVSSMSAQLSHLQASWTGSASVAFQSALERWRHAQREVEAALGDLGSAVSLAGQQYAQAETATLGLFR